MASKTFPKIDVYKTGGEFVTPYGETKFLKGQGRKKDRNIDTWEDKRQKRLIREWLMSRKKKKTK